MKECNEIVFKFSISEVDGEFMASFEGENGVHYGGGGNTEFEAIDKAAFMLKNRHSLSTDSHP